MLELGPAPRSLVLPAEVEEGLDGDRLALLREVAGLELALVVLAERERSRRIGAERVVRLREQRDLVGARLGLRLEQPGQMDGGRIRWVGH